MLITRFSVLHKALGNETAEAPADKMS